MEKPFHSAKANRILYVCVVATLCVVAIVIGIAAAANRPDGQDTPPATTPPQDNTQNQPNQPDQPTGAGESEEQEFLCPLSGTVVQEHDTETLVFSPTMGDWRIHTGMDIAASLGDTVCASADGTVKEVWDDAMMGKCVSIAHADNVVTVYKNLDATLAEGIAAGRSVRAGDSIGTVGESAMAELADEPHLHFEMTVNGEPVDPLSYLSDESKQASLTVKDEVYED